MKKLQYYQKITSRNVGIFNKSEQKILNNSTIAIAGVGGIGGLLAERLVRLGIGHIKIADPEVFEYSNLNRQFGCYKSTIGKNKALVIGKILKNINPFLKIEVFEKGINRENIDKFIKDTNFVIDEIEYNELEVILLLHDKCRERKKYIATGFAVGFGCSVFIFSPNGISLKEFFKIPLKYEKNKFLKLSPKKIYPLKLSYISKDTTKKILAGKQKYMPTISSGVALASIVLATETAIFLLKKRPLIIVPNYIVTDLFIQKIIKYS